jgi:AP-2 complex subunit beta-1
MPSSSPAYESVHPEIKVNLTISLQGKVAELRHELQAGGKKDKNHSAKKIALKRIVANMTMPSNDMVALFPDVINCMNIPNLEIKKM